MSDGGFTPGAQVASGHGHETALGVVDRLTRTQILVRFSRNHEPVRYHKEGLRRVGAGTWDRNVHIRLATEKDRIEVEWRRIRYRAGGLAKESPPNRAAAVQLREELDSFIARTEPQKETDR